MQYVIALQFFNHITEQHTRRSHEMKGKATCSIVEDDLSAQFVIEDDVFHFTCELDTIIEKQEDFDATEDKVV